MRKTNALFVATIVAATIAAPVGGIARAAPSHVVVESRFTVGYGGEPAPTMSECKVQVPRGGSGIAVLKAAKRAGCIDSYVLTRWKWDGRWETMVECINGVCGYPAGDGAVFVTAWWLFYSPCTPRSGRSSSCGYGGGPLEGFRAGRSTTLEFRYSPTD
jgi:hypothetical protein